MNILRTIFRLLFFRITREEILSFQWKHFVGGLLGTWIVGMGRYWDDPGALILQKFGLGSVMYIFVLSFLIWLIIKPFNIQKWNYFLVLTFVSLTSFPAIFYAIPVEKFISIQSANVINVGFLAVVAAWRLGLLFFFIKKATTLSDGIIMTVTLLPICLIITALTVLNLHRVVFDLMAGRRNPTPHDDTYVVLIFLTVASAILVGPLLISYFIGIYKARKRKNNDPFKENKLLRD